MLDLYTRFAVGLSQLQYKLSEQKGQGMVEYGLIIALVSVALIAALLLMTGALGKIFGDITTALNGA